MTGLADRLTYAALLALAACIGLGDVSPTSPFGLVRLLLPVTLALSLFAGIARRERLRWPGAIGVPLLAWLGVLMLSTLLAPAHRQDALWALERPIGGALLAVAVFAICRDARRAIGLAKALAVGGVVIALVGLAQASGNAAVGAWLEALHDGGVPIGDVPRVASTLSHPNVAAIVLELTLPLAIAWWWSARGPSRVVLAAASAACLLALVLTFSRAGLLAAILVLLLMATQSLRRGRVHLAVALAFMALVVPLALAWTSFADPGLDRRLTAGLDESGATSPARPVYWAAALSMARDYPLLGVGPDNYRWLFATYTGIDVDNVGVHAHNQVLEALADTGVLGTATLVWFVSSVVWTLARAQRAWLWRLAVLSALCAWFAHALLDDFERFWPASVGFWLLVGLAVRLARAQPLQKTEQALGRIPLGREVDTRQPRLAAMLGPSAQRDDAALWAHGAERGEVPGGQPRQIPVEQDHVAAGGDDLVDQRLARRGLTHN